MSKNTPRLVRFAFIATAIALLSASCTATETVTINEAAFLTDDVAAPAEAVTEDETAPAEAVTEDETAPQEDATEAVPAVEATAEPAPTEAAEPNTSPSDSGECVYLGVDGFGDMQIRLTFIADIATQDDVWAEYELRSAAGVVFVASSTYLEDVLPGEPVDVHVDTLEDGPVQGSDDVDLACQFLGLDPFGFGDAPYRASDFDLCSFVEIDEFGDLQIEIVVTNPTGINTELAVDYALRGPGGVRFGDGVAFSGVEALANAQTTMQVDTFTEFPDWVSADSFTCDVLAIEAF